MTPSSDSHIPIEVGRLAAVRRLPPLARPEPPQETWTPLSDPFVQGLAAVLNCGLFGMAAWAFRGSGYVLLGAAAIVVAITSAAWFVLLVGRAVSREKLIEYWSDRRELRLELRKVRARNELLTATVLCIHDWQEGTQPRVQAALANLVDRAAAVLAAHHDDIAVLVATERHERWMISHTAAPGGSRWSYLTAGKQCRVGTQTVEGKLGKLARYHRAFVAEIPDGRLVLAVLCQSALDDDAVEGLVRELHVCFDLLAAYWERGAPEQMPDLRPVGGRGG